uniref:S-adenosyl-L-methionine-dependent tRNA methyltransferase ABH8 n=1 Tax=Parastrongyloides trichosuri TaxID=131310 RepID=A0A0N4ZKF0_PARTI
MNEKKIKKQITKTISQVKRHYPQIELSDIPTRFLLISNSSLSCGVTLDDLENIFNQFDSDYSLYIYPVGRSYSFLACSCTNNAITILKTLQGKVPDELLKLGKPFNPFFITYVNCVPDEEKKENMLFPKGLKMIDDYINNEIASNIIKKIENDVIKNGEILKNRTVLHYGYKFNYDNNFALQQTTPIPNEFYDIIKRLEVDNLLENSEIPDQITVNIYEESQGIPFHIDTHSAFGKQIISLSLLSDVVMQFKDCANPAVIRNVLLKENSLIIMEDESRYKFKHGILNRKFDINPLTNRVMKRNKRISITFRKVQNTRCQCKFIEYCDWDRNGEMAIPKENKNGKILESSYVQEVYENIAEHFDETRHSQWKAVSKFLDSIPPYSVLFDLGCGNGKYLIRKDKLIKIGSDLCFNLCQIAYNKGCNVLQADILNLPFKPESADAVISIAVIHHLSTKSRRLEALKQIRKILKVGGRGCITVWAMNQKESQYEIMRSNKEDEEPLVDNNMLRVHSGKQFIQQDMLVPWQKDKEGEKQFLRYYHMFVDGELEEIINSVDGLKVHECILEQGNWIITFEKIF